MSVLAERVDVWAAPIQDEPGGLARVLTGLKEAGADLDFIIARRSPEHDGKAVLFVTPIRGDEETEAAANLGFNVTTSVHSLRIEGDNRQGLAAQMTTKLAKAGINMRGFSGAVLGTRFIVYIGFDSDQDCRKAQDILGKM